MKPIHRWVLPNGLTVMYRQSDGVPLAAATMLLRTGSVYETPPQAGLANLTMEVLLQGTHRRSSRQLADEIESMGASLGAQAADDYTEIGFVAPAAHLDDILEIFSDVITAPAFRPAEFSKERANVLAGLKSRKDALFNVAYDAFNSLLFGATHPYGRPIDGQVRTVEHFRRHDLITWHREHFHPRRAIFSLIASLPFPQAKTKIERYMKPWRSMSHIQAVSADAPAGPSQAQKRQLKARFEQAYLMTGVAAPGVLEPDYPTLKVLNTLLGGGMSSRLFLRLREELGLAYEVTSFFPTHWLSSEWVIYLGLPPEKLPLARKELEKILEVLVHRAPRREEVQQAIAMIKGSFLMEQQTRRRQAWYTAWWEFLGKGPDYNKHFLSTIERVTPIQVGALARRLLKQPRITVEVVPQGYNGKKK